MPLLRQKDIDEFESEFHAIQTMFDDASPLGHKPYREAGVQLEILEELGRRLDVVDNLIKMRLQLRDHIASDNSRLKEVDVHNIVDQKLIPLRSPR
ncbi:hypothetical protein FRC12_012368, partial [Ceratobasidium sp. 428]